MRKFKNKIWSDGRKRKLATLVSVALAGLAVFAIAQLLINSEGEGGVQVAGAGNITVSRPVTMGTIARGADGAASFRVTNANSAAATLWDITPPTVNSGESSNPTECPWQNLTVNEVHFVGTVVPANAVDYEVQVPAAYHLAADAPAACLGTTLYRSVRATFGLE